MVSTRQQTISNNAMVTRSGRYNKPVQHISLPNKRIPKRKVETTDIETNTVHIDFDDAHDCWMENKRRLGNGMYVYICGKLLKNGKKCQRAQCDNNGFNSGCRMHYMWEEKEHKHMYDDVALANLSWRKTKHKSVDSDKEVKNTRLQLQQLHII